MINKIDGTGPIRTPTTVRRVAKTGAVGGSSFSKQLEETSEADSLSATQGANALGNVAGVIGLQEVDDALTRAAKGKMRAEDILAKLDDLRLDLLAGAVSRDKLLQLTHLVASRRHEVTDPRLGEVLDEIDLRAQVELAKHSLSKPNS